MFFLISYSLFGSFFTALLVNIFLETPIRKLLSKGPKQQATLEPKKIIISDEKPTADQHTESESDEQAM